MDPKEVGIRIDAVPRRVLAQAILLSFSVAGKAARYIVCSMTYDRKSITIAEKSINAADKASSHSAVPNAPADALCLIIEALRERRIIVAPRRKLVMMVDLKFAASMSVLGCSDT